MRASRGGFTLVEALVALAISGILMVLVGATFMVQNEFYANVLQRSRLQDNARSAAEIVAGDLRALMPGGVVVADSARLVVRVPMEVGAVCSSGASIVSVYLPDGEAQLDPTMTAYVAARLTTYWDYFSDGVTWASLKTSGTPAASCFGQGADTVGARDRFYALNTGGTGSKGTVFMLYRITEYRIQPSALQSGATALFRGPYNGTLVELATPLAPDAHFAYRTNYGGWSNQVSSGLSLIRRVRIDARAQGPGATASEVDRRFDLVLDVPLRNTM